MQESVEREVVMNFIALWGRVGIVSLETSMYPTILDDTRFNFTFTCLTIFGRETSMYLERESQHLLLQLQDIQTCSFASLRPGPGEPQAIHVGPNSQSIVASMLSYMYSE